MIQSFSAEIIIAITYFLILTANIMLIKTSPNVLTSYYQLKIIYYLLPLKVIVIHIPW